MTNNNTKVYTTNSFYDAAFFQRQIDDGGLYPEELRKLLNMLDYDAPLLPLEIEGNSCIAIGFILEEAADRLDFDYKDLFSFVREILNDINKETPNNEYIFDGLDIFLGY